MKMISTIAAILCLFTLTCFSQRRDNIVTREGIIQTYQEKKQVRTRDFWVKYFSQKDSSYTDYDGKFKITFYKTPNYPTALLVYPSPFGDFKDYKIVNTYDINNILESDNSKIEVFIADKKIIKQQQELFYEIISAPIKKHYKDSIINLKIIYKDSIDKQNLLIENLTKELNKKDQRIKELSEQLGQADLELKLLKDNPLILQNDTYEKNCLRLIEAHDLFSQGKIDSARMCIPKNIDEISDLNIKESMMLFAFYQLDAVIEEILGNYSRAIEQYEKALKHISKDAFREYITYMNIAELENILNRSRNAPLDNVNKALELRINDMYKVKAYNLKGKIQQDCSNYQLAIKLYKAIKKEYDNAIIGSVEKEVAISYTLLGDYYKRERKNESAKANYHKALNIYTELNKTGEIEAEAQCVVLLKLAAIYESENKASMVKKCIGRITLLEEEDSTIITQNPKINLQRAIYYMQNKNFSEASKFYTRVLENYEKNPNLYQQELIETMFLCGLNQFYNKESYGSYGEALYYFSQADTLLKKDSTLLGSDSIRLKMLCMAAIGITKKEQGDQENGLALYNQAIDIVKSDINLSDNDKKLLLKDMSHLKKYKNMEINDFSIKLIGVVGGLLILCLAF